MVKAVAYALITTALIVFIVFSPTKQRGSDQRGLNRRLGLKVTFPNFDPLITELVRKDGGKSLEKGTISATGANDYYTDEGKLNITLRLMVLFPLLDNSPKDGVVSLNELGAWNIARAREQLSYRTDKELAYYDKDGDGEVSFKEYLPQFSDEDTDRNGMEHGEAGWWKEQFINADVDQNGTLSFNEFMNFLHPEDSDNKEIQKWLLREKLKRMDYNSDGKLDLKEFKDHIYDIYKSYIEFESADGRPPTPEEKFANLDANNDKFLEVEEMIAILHYLNPGELSHAKYYTSYLIRKADDNGDGSLSLKEILSHEDMFYSSLFEDEEEDEDFHDEL